MESVAKPKVAAVVAPPLKVHRKRPQIPHEEPRESKGSLLQADNSFNGAARPHTEMVHLATVGGRHASPYNVWIHWLQNEEPDQFVKRSKADFDLQISVGR